jgi:hypothetical protein
VADDLPPDTPLIERQVLVAQAVRKARRCGAPYVDTQHVLLAMARLPNSTLPACGATAELLDLTLSVVERESRPARPPAARSLGAAFRTLLVWLRGRA